MNRRRFAALPLLLAAGGCWGTEDELLPHAAGCADPKQASCGSSGWKLTDGKACSTPSAQAAKIWFKNGFPTRTLRISIVKAECDLLNVVVLPPGASSPEYDAGDNQVWQIDDDQTKEQVMQLVITEGGTHAVAVP
ncbi:MAG: hypothetical protein L6Q84_33890 [Polyangiaceae bacterium]|nr:hypothetical protein [Polyangiaceae bacterium]